MGSGPPHPLRLGLRITQQVHPIAVQREIWRAAEAGGFDHLWAYDHLFALGGDPAQPILDGWTVLGAMAEATTRIRIGLNVSGNLYRHPGVLAKIATTVDHLSAGRLEFGLGASWSEPEFAMLGLPFPGPADRVRMLEESCRVVRGLWTEPRFTLRGRYYTVTEAIAEPKPVQRPHPPIWIGGSGPQLTLRVVAKHADVWNAQGAPIEKLVEASGVLDRHCAAVGRDPATLRRSVGLPMASADEMVEKAAERFRAGFSEILLTVGSMKPTDDPRRDLEVLLGSVVPRIRALA